MTFFIAALLIYQFEMNPWLYVVAGAIWFVDVLGPALHRLYLRYLLTSEIWRAAIATQDKLSN